ncbi:hypothetical protein [Xanthomonas theicola]|nr:hypothetical protein [Xanthomonas theicola]
MQIATIVCIGVGIGAVLGIAGHPLIGLLFFGGSAMTFNIATKE